jgi:putative ABC transport system ATP-binding protein
MIKLENVDKSYGQEQVLKGITLRIDKGEFVSITGISGSGKSTLLNLIGGMDRPDKGRVIVDGEVISSSSDENLTVYRRKKIGFIFQFFNLLPNVTVLENIRMPLLLNGTDDENRARSYIRRVGLQGKEIHFPFELSGGQQQRVAIARALVHDPDIILADEPTGSLDSQTGEEIMELIKELSSESRKTVVLVTHETYLTKFADRTLKIRDGIIRS